MNPTQIRAAALAAVLLAGTSVAALAQGTATTPGATPGAVATTVDDDDDGFDLGWLGLLGLIGLAGLRGRKHEQHVATTTRPRV